MKSLGIDGTKVWAWMLVFVAWLALVPAAVADEHLKIELDPAASFRNTPSWWTDYSSATNKGHKVFLPNYERTTYLAPAEDQPPSKRGQLSQIALVCTVDLGDRKFDGLAPFASRKSVYGDISLAAGHSPKRNKAPKLWSLGTGAEDANSARVILPIQTLQPGHVIRIRVFDRDVTFHDHLASLKLTYTGFLPLPIKHRIVSGECQLLESEKYRAELERSAKRADSQLSRAEDKARVTMTGHPGQGVDQQLRDSRKACVQLAALTGWASGELVPLLARLESLTQKLESGYREAFSQLQDQAISEPGWHKVAHGQLSLRLTDLSCGKKNLRPYRSAIPGFRIQEKNICAFRLGLRNETSQAQKINQRFYGPLEKLLLTDARGQAQHFSPDHIWRKGRPRDMPFDGLSLKPGRTVELVVTARLNEELLLKPKLPLLLKTVHRNTMLLKGSTEMQSLVEGQIGVQVRGLQCDTESLRPVAKAAGLPSFRKEFCVLTVRLSNTGEGTIKPYDWARKLYVKSGKRGFGRTRTSVPLAADQPPRKADPEYKIVSGASVDYRLVLQKSPKKISEIQLALKVGQAIWLELNQTP